MLGLIFIYFIGKYFADLAVDFQKKKWAWAIIGVAFYYASTFVAGILLGILYVYFGKDIETENDFVIGIIAIPVALLFTTGFYWLLKNIWTHQASKKRVGEILD